MRADRRLSAAPSAVRSPQTAILEPLAAIRRSVRAARRLPGPRSATTTPPTWWRRCGGSACRVLINQTHHVRRGGQAIALTGIDDVHRYYTPAADRRAGGARSGQAFGIVLAHSPEMAGRGRRRRATTCICAATATAVSCACRAGAR